LPPKAYALRPEEFRVAKIVGVALARYRAWL